MFQNAICSIFKASLANTLSDEPSLIFRANNTSEYPHCESDESRELSTALWIHSIMCCSSIPIHTWLAGEGNCLFKCGNQSGLLQFVWGNPAQWMETSQVTAHCTKQSVLARLRKQPLLLSPLPSLFSHCIPSLLSHLFSTSFSILSPLSHLYYTSLHILTFPLRSLTLFTSYIMISFNRF